MCDHLEFGAGPRLYLWSLIVAYLSPRAPCDLFRAWIAVRWSSRSGGEASEGKTFASAGRTGCHVHSQIEMKEEVTHPHLGDAPHVKSQQIATPSSTVARDDALGYSGRGVELCEFTGVSAGTEGAVAQPTKVLFSSGTFGGDTHLRSQFS